MEYDDKGKVYLKMSEKELKEYIKNKENEEAKNLFDEEKLYQVPITYYNISDLKITKEIEQRLMYMMPRQVSILLRIFRLALKNLKKRNLKNSLMMRFLTLSSSL